MAAGKTYMSAFDRLKALPEVFTGTDPNMVFGWTSGVSSTYLANWKRAGLVKSLGGRSNVHMNLVVNPHVDPDIALRRLYPSAVRTGVDILREAGWTTQIPACPEVVVPQGEPLYALDGFVLATRAASWFAQVAPGLQRSDTRLARLRPAWALADMLARAADRRVRDAWLLDPDDLDLLSAAEDSEMPAALAALGLKSEVLQPQRYSDLLDQRQSLPPREPSGVVVLRRGSRPRPRG